jgi:nucleoside-diphosphate-sugar epimerase
MSLPAAVVTGVPGWLGTRLVLALAQGLPDVPALKGGNPDRPIRCLVYRGLDASSLRTIPGRIELVDGDLTDPVSLTGLFKGLSEKVVFHCAGVIHPGRWVREFYAVNTEGTLNLVEAAVKAGATRFIHVSSNSPMGVNPTRDQQFDESSHYNPYMNYGKSKKLAEDVVNAAGQSGRIETVIVRAPWYYGPGQPERQTRFFTMIKNGTVPIVGDGENLRSMVYVDNLCQGLILCEKTSEAKGQTYWLADRKPYTMNQIIDTIQRVMENDFSIPVVRGHRRMPGIVSEIARFADKIIQGIGLYQQEIHVLSEMNKNIACSISKAEKKLGYDPKIDLEEGMRRSIKWLIDNGIEI